MISTSRSGITAWSCSSAASSDTRPQRQSNEVTFRCPGGAPIGQIRPPPPQSVLCKRRAEMITFRANNYSAEQMFLFRLSGTTPPPLIGGASRYRTVNNLARQYLTWTRTRSRKNTSSSVHDGVDELHDGDVLPEVPVRFDIHQVFIRVRVSCGVVCERGRVQRDPSPGTPPSRLKMHVASNCPGRSTPDNFRSCERRDR